MAETALRADSASPLYAQLMERIRIDILEGVYPAGEKIPPEHELETRYRVSRVTVRRALQELTAAGLLERKQGKGTFVSMPKPEIRERRIESFHDRCRAEGKTPSAQVIRTGERAASARDREALILGPEARVVEIVRVLRADGEPVILEKSHFSTAYSWLEGAGLNGSLYRVLQEYGVQAEKSIYDLSLRKTNAEEAKLLQVPEGTTVLAVEQVVYDQRGRPLHTGERLIRGEKYTLKI